MEKNPLCGGDPPTPLQRSSSPQSSTTPNPPTPQETRPSASERKSGCSDGAASTITDIEIRMRRWYSGDNRFTRQEQEQLTQKAKAIMEHDRGPRTPPAISIRECQEAIEIAGGIRISLRGEERLITEVRTGGAGNSRWPKLQHNPHKASPALLHSLLLGCNGNVTRRAARPPVRSWRARCVRRRRDRNGSGD